MSERGDRGVQGERGPQGDHGQPGETGARGLIGSPDRRTVAVMFAVLAVYVTVLLWVSERHSCERQAGVRASAAVFADTAFEARTASARLARERGDQAAFEVDTRAAKRYAESKRLAGPLDCGGLFPDTE